MTSPTARTIGAVLAEQAARRGDDIYVRVAGADVTYAQLAARARRLAVGLASVGVRRGDRVLVALPNIVEFLQVAFGLATIGAVQVPIDPQQKSHHVRYVLDDATPVAAVATTDFLVAHSAAIADSSVRTAVVVGDGPVGDPRVAYDDVIARGAGSDDPHFADVAPWDPYCLIYTSGTTGAPKGVLLCHEHQLTLAGNIAASVKLTAADCFYNFFPLHHNTGQGIIALSTLVVGGRMLLIERFTRTRFWSDVVDHGCTVFFGMGSLLEMLVRDADGAAASRGHRLRAGWAIAITDEQADRFADAFGVRFVTGYGSTEANMVAIAGPDERRPGHAGRVLPDFEVIAVDEHDSPVPPGEVGELVVRPRRPFITGLGYWGNPHATLAAWRNLWLHTGDAGRVDATGNLAFVDRIADVIRHRGNNVASAEVEAVVGALTAVAEVAAIPAPTEFGGYDQDVCVVVVASGELDPAAVVAHCRSLLPSHAVPRYVAVVDGLPRTETGKVKKHELRAMNLHVAAWDAAAESAPVAR